MFTVFVAFYLYTDHAPWWVWLLALAGWAIDKHNEEVSRVYEAASHKLLADIRDALERDRA